MYRRILLTIFALICAGTFSHSAAQAQATRTWVSGVGDDVNPCSRTAPCKTFAGAISKTATNGEINCLDPAGFGSVNITKSITIECSHTVGGVLALNTNGVIVNGAGIIVNLRGLDINGAGGATGNGIRILNATAVNIDNTNIYGFAGAGPTNGRGISIETSGSVRVTVQHSHIFNNNFIGIHSVPTGGSVILSVDGVNITKNNNTGIQLRQLTTATIHNTSVTNSPGGAGLTAELSTVTAAVVNSNFSNNAFGLFVGNGGNPIIRLYDTVITGNTTAGLGIVPGSQVITAGNNMIRGNTGNETPTSSESTQ